MLALNSELIQRLVKERFGGSFSRLAEAFAAEPPHRSTVLRWVRGEAYPRTGRQTVALAAALGVDPFALWKLDRKLFPRLCARGRSASREGRWAHFLASLSFVDDFVWPTDDWPPLWIADENGGQWHTVHFFHRAQDRKNYYARLLIQPEITTAAPGGRRFASPQVWHFAFRDTGVPHAPWRPYGFVILDGGEISLFAFTGFSHAASVPTVASSFVVETWFGEWPAEFCIASLHAFSLVADAPESDGLPCVCFGASAG